MTPATMTRPAPAAPDRSLEQRLQALERANGIRALRSQLKRDLNAGRASVHALLLDPPAYVETMKVLDLLLSTPKYGLVKANKVLTQCRLSPSKTIGGLSGRQRGELAGLLRRGATEADRRAYAEQLGRPAPRRIGGPRA